MIPATELLLQPATLLDLDLLLLLGLLGDGREGTVSALGRAGGEVLHRLLGDHAGGAGGPRGVELSKRLDAGLLRHDGRGAAAETLWARGGEVEVVVLFFVVRGGGDAGCGAGRRRRLRR